MSDFDRLYEALKVVADELFCNFEELTDDLARASLLDRELQEEYDTRFGAEG